MITKRPENPFSRVPPRLNARWPFPRIAPDFGVMSRGGAADFTPVPLSRDLQRRAVQTTDTTTYDQS
jgi:hypothetical protein